MSEDKIEREMLLLEPIEQHPYHNHQNRPAQLNNIIKQTSNGGIGSGGGGGKRGKDTSGEHFTQDLVRQVNLRNFKILAIILVAVFIFYHGYLNSFYGK